MKPAFINLRDNYASVAAVGQAALFREIGWEDLIGNWERKGKQGRGAPVDVKLGQDGDIYMADDHNGLVLKLHYAAPGKP